MGCYLRNNKREYFKRVDLINGIIEFTNNTEEAENYEGKPGGGTWSANNEKDFLVNHFQESEGERVTSLEPYWTSSTKYKDSNLKI